MAVATGNSSDLLAQAPTLPKSLSESEFFGSEAAQRQHDENRALMRERMRAERIARQSEGWTAPVLPPVMGARISNYDRERRQQMLEDIRTNAKLRVDPKTGRKLASVFRSGKLEAPEARGVEAPSYAAADEHRPTGRIGRTEGLFASVGLDTGARWLLANASIVRMEDYSLREITVDPDETYIYSVRNWEQASGQHPDRREMTDAERERFDVAAKKFWSESMTLTQWYGYMEANPEVDPRDWEILLRPEDAQRAKPVSVQRLIKGSFRDHERRELEGLQKQEQRARRQRR